MRGDAGAGLRAVIAEAVLARPPVNGMRLVGVDGPSGSGKSTVARRLASQLAAPIVEMDDFVSWDSFGGWWPRFDAQVLRPLLEGRDAVFQARDWDDWYGSSLGSWKTVRWAPTMILEGVTCTRRETAGLLCYAVWVEAPESVRLARGLARDSAFAGAADLWRRWMAEERAFFEQDGTRDRADTIIDTSPER